MKEIPRGGAETALGAGESPAEEASGEAAF